MKTDKFIPFYNPQMTINDVLNSILCNNPKNKLKKEFIKYFGIGDVVLTGSGRHALKLALKSLGVSKEDEVIIPPFICPCVGKAVLEMNATPVFGDNDENSLNMSAESVEEAISIKTKAIVIAHIGGIPGQLNKFIEISRKYNIPLIEDCAQSFGAKYDRKFTGLHGDYGLFSFGISKNINSVGGGALYCKEFYETEKFFKNINRASKKSKLIKNEYFIPIFAPIVFNNVVSKYIQKYLQSYSTDKYNNSPFEFNEREITNIEAYIAFSKIKTYDVTKKLRNENAKIYYEYFDGIFDFVEIPGKAEPAYLYFPVLLKDFSKMKKLKKEIIAKGIEVKDKSDIKFFALWEHPKFRAYKHCGDNVVNIENRYLLFPVSHAAYTVEKICRSVVKGSKQ